MNLHSYYSGQRLLEFYGGLAGISSADRSRTAAELLERVGIEDAAEQTISKYSKGMLQRLGLAQALLNDPDLLILDEPTSNLGRNRPSGFPRCPAAAQIKRKNSIHLFAHPLGG